MSWWQLRIAAHATQAEEIESCMQSLGAVSVTMQDAGRGSDETPIFEPEPGTAPLWPDTQVTGLFDADPAAAVRLRARLAEILGVAETRISCQRLEEQDWERAWLRYFKPLRFGDRLWVIPDGYTPPDETAINLFLDPGLAFGTGTHPTTALCLQWLAAHLEPGAGVVDYGCGSGILSVAAAALGAARLWCIDIDPQALQATRANLEKNRISIPIHTVLPQDFQPDDRPTLIIANILAKPLITLAGDFASLLDPGRILVISGIMSEQTDDLLQVYEKHFERFKILSKDGWMLIECRRS